MCRFPLVGVILAIAWLAPTAAGAAGRPAGDTIEAAILIASTPYSDIGTTAGFADDYDEACPYSGSTSPDVVYAYTPSEEVLVTVDLCGSAYDTKVYIYDSALSLVACNDDFYADLECGVMVSKLEYVHLNGGETYYLVLDGYGGSSGEYRLEISALAAVHLAFPAAGFLEGEPDLISGYVDAYNGDVGHAQWILQSAGIGELYLPPYFCESGWSASFADEDWFVVNPSWSEGIGPIMVMTESPILVEQLFDEGYVIQSMTVLPGEQGEFELYPLYWWPYLRVTAIPGTSPPNPDEVVAFHYRLQDPSRPPEYDAQLTASNDRCVGLHPVPAFHTIETIESYGFFWYEGDTGSGQFTNNYDAGTTGCLTEAADGSDVVVELFLWERPLTVRLIANGWPGVAYLVTDCGDPGGSCVAATDQEGYFTFDPPDDPLQAGYYYLIIDGYGGSSGRFEIEGSFRYPQGFVYPYGPYGGLPDNDLCDGARPLGEGSFAITQHLGIAHNDYDPGDQGCTGWGDTGMDVAYYADLVPGQVLDVTMTTDAHWDDSLYLVTDCNDPGASCVAGADADPDGSRLTYQATAAGRFYLIADSYGIEPDGFTLTGSIAAAVATPPGAEGPLALTCEPNPCNPKASFRFGLTRDQRVRLAIFDLRGRRVAQILDETIAAGRHRVEWSGRDADGRGVESGVFFARFESEEFDQTLKLILVR